tara:strand:+ start:59 stop:682 length:624 start_codon:yes stop_codon:yes gene_type:complete
MNIKKRPCLILDLDETVIHSVSLDERNGLSKEEKKIMDTFKSHNMDDYYTVLERPGLQEFLDFVFKNFNVSVWTAASKDYALFIVENIILGKQKSTNKRQLDWIMFSYHCDVSKKEKKGSKVLSLLWDFYDIKGCSPDNTIILDDHPDVYASQKNNCIHISPFDILNKDVETDDLLYKLKDHLTQTLVKLENGEGLDIKHINDQILF